MGGGESACSASSRATPTIETGGPITTSGAVNILHEHAAVGATRR
jgi:hypothetical protein